MQLRPPEADKRSQAYVQGNACEYPQSTTFFSFLFFSLFFNCILRLSPTHRVRAISHKAAQLLVQRVVDCKRQA